MEELLIILNECIIRAASEDVWNEIKGDVITLIKRILSGDLTEFSSKYRLERLCPSEIEIYDIDALFFEENIFNSFELWYFTSALSGFDMGQIRTIFSGILKYMEDNDIDRSLVSHLNFKPLSDTLWYDYEGTKHINIYKKRIIEAAHL